MRQDSPDDRGPAMPTLPDRGVRAGFSSTAANRWLIADVVTKI